MQIGAPLAAPLIPLLIASSGVIGKRGLGWGSWFIRFDFRLKLFNPMIFMFKC
jgi:hypothetical protein